MKGPTYRGGGIFKCGNSEYRTAAVIKGEAHKNEYIEIRAQKGTGETAREGRTLH